MVLSSTRYVEYLNQCHNIGPPKVIDSDSVSSEQHPQSVDDISQRIVAAAAEQFIQDGYEGASTAAIAKLAKTSKREIYARFENKEGLFKQVMAYICGLAPESNEPESPAPDSLEHILLQTAQAVLTRFLLEETRGVLVCAIGASPKFPSIPDLFWREGPGQAAEQLALLFKNEPSLTVKNPKQVARQYLLDCCGPFVLGILFDPKAKPTAKQTAAHLNAVTANLIAEYSN